MQYSTVHSSSSSNNPQPPARGAKINTEQWSGDTEEEKLHYTAVLKSMLVLSIVDLPGWVRQMQGVGLVVTVLRGGGGVFTEGGFCSAAGTERN